MTCSATRRPRSLPGSAIVTVPAELATGDPICFRQDRDDPCGRARRRVASRGPFAPAPQPASIRRSYYALVGLPARVVGEEWSSDAHRVVAALLVVAGARDRPQSGHAGLGRAAPPRRRRRLPGGVVPLRRRQPERDRDRAGAARLGRRGPAPAGCRSGGRSRGSPSPAAAAIVVRPVAMLAAVAIAASAAVLVDGGVAAARPARRSDRRRSARHRSVELAGSGSTSPTHAPQRRRRFRTALWKAVDGHPVDAARVRRLAELAGDVGSVAGDGAVGVGAVAIVDDRWTCGTSRGTRRARSVARRPRRRTGGVRGRSPMIGSDSSGRAATRSRRSSASARSPRAHASADGDPASATRVHAGGSRGRPCSSRGRDRRGGGVLGRPATVHRRHRRFAAARRTARLAAS